MTAEPADVRFEYDGKDREDIVGAPADVYDDDRLTAE
jgi:hypothetical protein